MSVIASSIDRPDIGAPAPPSNIPVVILAGGLATRMGGGDKPLLQLGDRAVLDHVLAGLREQVGRVALNANGDPARFSAWDLPVLPDPMADRLGPLGGILAAMRWAAPFADRVLSWPGDTPHPPSDLVRRLSAVNDGRVVCASSGGRIHPVIALWPVALSGELTEWLRRRDRRVSGFAKAAGLAVVEWDDTADPFHNLNTPADLAAAERRL